MHSKYLSGDGIVNIHANAEEMSYIGIAHGFIHFRIFGCSDIFGTSGDEGSTEPIHIGGGGHLDGKFGIARIAIRMCAFLAGEYGQPSRT